MEKEESRRFFLMKSDALMLQCTCLVEVPVLGEQRRWKVYFFLKVLGLGGDRVTFVSVQGVDKNA